MFFKRPAGISWIVAFLGNPGTDYECTRHNAGFMAGDVFAETHDVKINKSKFRALTASCTVGDDKVLLMKPQTYMNLSGEAVAQAASFYKIKPEHVIVLSDEMSLPIGKIRVRSSGSAGGHNGLKNIIAELGTEAFPRIRIGVGAPPSVDYDMKDWVLGHFTGKDLDDMHQSTSRAAAAAEYYILHGCSETMNKFN